MNDAQQAALMVQLHAQKAQLQQKNKEIAEKDLEIKKLQTEIEEYEIALDLAAKRDGNHAKITLSATADNERLRRALEKARYYLERDSHIPALNVINRALGEDDKECSQTVTVTIHNRGYVKNELNFGEGDES